MQDKLKSSLECARNEWNLCKRALRRANPLGAMVWQYLGSDYCYGIKEGNRDYYELAFAFELIPRERIYESSKIRLSLKLWFQLGAGPRSAFLDCPSAQTCDPEQCFDSKGCIREHWDYGAACFPPTDGCDACYEVHHGCEDCKRSCSTRSCEQDSDCCGLPGVVCRPNDAGSVDVTGVACNQEQGVCEKPHFLRMVDYGMDYTVERLGKCTKWLDPACHPVLIQAPKSVLKRLLPGNLQLTQLR